MSLKTKEKLYEVITQKRARKRKFEGYKNQNCVKENDVPKKKYIINPKKLLFKFSKTFNYKPKAEKLSIVVEHQTHEDLIKENWCEVHETFLKKLLGYDKAIVNLIILVKFFEEDRNDFLFQQKYFQSKSALTTKETAVRVLTDLCEEIVTKTNEFEKCNQILGENFLSKVILNITKTSEESLFLEDEEKNHCKKCSSHMIKTATPKQANGAAARVIKVQHTFRNVQPNCLNLSKFFAKIKAHIARAIGETLAKRHVIAASLNFALCCEYLAYFDTEFMSELKFFESKKEITRVEEFDFLLLEKVVSSLLAALKSFQNTYSFLVLERFYCLELGIEQKFASKTKAAAEKQKTQQNESYKTITTYRHTFELPKWIEVTKACSSLTQDRFRYSFRRAIIAALSPFWKKFQGSIVNKIRNKQHTLSNGVILDFDGLPRTMQLQGFDVFEEKNPDLSIDVFVCNLDNKIITGKLYQSNRQNAKTHINLLCLQNQGACYFVWIKDLVRLIEANSKRLQADIRFLDISL